MKNLLFVISLSFTSLFAVAQNVKVSLEQFGAKADAIALSDGNINAGSNTLTSKSALFTQADIGKIIFVAGAADKGNTVIGTIVSVNSKNSVTISQAAVLTVNNSGITYGTDCTDAFIRFNKSARTTKYVTLNMQPGTYLTKFNNWLSGIKSITVNGNGCNIICTHGAYQPFNSARANVGLFMPCCFDNVDNNYYENNQLSNVSYGYKIKTSAKGAQMVEAMNDNDVGNFNQGNWVLIYGFHHEDFGGWPPDPRFFEYAKITKIDKASGKIYLDRTLKNLYDSGWPDGSAKSGVGAARIINLNRDNFNIVENLTLKNIHFTPFNGWNGKYADTVRNSRFELYGFIYGNVSNITAAGAYFGQGEKLLVNNITLTGACEPDKILDSCIIKNSKIARFVGAGGLNYLELVNNTFSDGFNASPRTLYVVGNTFKTVGTTSQSLAAFGFNKEIDYIKLGTNTWDCSSSTKRYLLSPPLAVTMTVGAVVNNNTITIPNNLFVKAHNTRRVLPGSVGYTTSGKSLEITRVYQYDENNIAVSGIWTNGNPNQGDNYIFQMMPNIEISGKQIKTGAYSNNFSLFQSLAPRIHLNMKDESFRN